MKFWATFAISMIIAYHPTNQAMDGTYRKLKVGGGWRQTVVL